MMWILFWMFLCVIAGVIAAGKDRSGVGFFFLAFFLSPLVGIIAALVVKRNTAAIEQKQMDAFEKRKCPHCAELIRPDAKICRFCHQPVEPIPEEQIKEAQTSCIVQRPTYDEKPRKKTTCIVG
jgi:hypothetical protein